VFDGTKVGPYSESDEPNPLNTYGRSKLAGDRAIQAVDPPHYIFRTSWVYAARGNNFLNTMLRLARERSEIRIVNDQVGAPTWARFLADTTTRVVGLTLKDSAVAREKRGLYNLTASGHTSWFGFAEAIFSETRGAAAQKLPVLTPISTSQYPVPARRPANSRLDNSKFIQSFGIEPPSWSALLSACLRERESTE